MKHMRKFYDVELQTTVKVTQIPKKDAFQKLSQRLRDRNITLKISVGLLCIVNIRIGTINSDECLKYHRRGIWQMKKFKVEYERQKLSIIIIHSKETLKIR